MNAEKKVFGRAEEVLVFKEELKFKARLDTGAEVSSLLAINIKKIKDTTTDKVWVSFQTIDQQTGKPIDKKFPLKRYMSIKQHKKKANGKFKYMRRPVIMLLVCLGNQRQIIEVNLVDRSHFSFPLLLGTNAINQFNAVVDPSKEFTSIPTCEVMP